MKKVLLFILFFGFTTSFGQTKFNPDSVNYYFMEILNKYRNENQLWPLKINFKIKEFADRHVEYLLLNKHNPVVHSNIPLSNGDNVKFRKYLDQYFTSQTNFTENICRTTIYEKMDNIKIIHAVNEMRITYQNMVDYGPTNAIVARIAFLHWKNSPSHNEILLSRNITDFYLSYGNINSDYFFEFVGIN